MMIATPTGGGRAKRSAGFSPRASTRAQPQSRTGSVRWPGRHSYLSREILSPPRRMRPGGPNPPRSRSRSTPRAARLCMPPSSTRSGCGDRSSVRQTGTSTPSAASRTSQKRETSSTLISTSQRTAPDRSARPTAAGYRGSSTLIVDGSSLTGTGFSPERLPSLRIATRSGTLTSPHVAPTTSRSRSSARNMPQRLSESASGRRRAAAPTPTRASPRT